MAIEWTPWFNVPMHRRLEVLCIALFLFSILLGPICTILMLYLLYAGSMYSKIICGSYLAFCWFDRHACDRGGRGSGVAWFRNLRFWKYCLNYFPINLVKTVDLPPDRNYLICIFPHGTISFGAAGNFGINLARWTKLFPGTRPKLTTLSGNMLVPVYREVLLSCGMCGASVNSLKILLNQSNDPADESNRDGYTSNAVGLIVGGVKEQSYIYPNKYQFYLKTRKGFLRIALKTGAPLVPAISFGENDIMRFYHLIPGKFRIFYGRGFFQYNFGLIPLRRAITTVIGAPIYVEKIENPSEEDVNRIHQIFCTQIKELFDTHKSKYVENPENVQLEFV